MTASVVPLPADARVAGPARRLVRAQLLDWRLEDLLNAVVLLTSELVTNVLVHTGGVPSLGIDRAGAGVRVTVCDASPVLPVQRRRSASATTGRGVQLLEDLADKWAATVRRRASPCGSSSPRLAIRGGSIPQSCGRRRRKGRERRGVAAGPLRAAAGRG